MDDTKVAYTRAEILKAIRLVDSVVVSDDRLGSRLSGLPTDEAHELILKYWSEFSPYQRLAEAREILSSAFSTQLGDDDRDELERELQDNDYWPD